MKRILATTLTLVALTGCGLASALNASNPNLSKTNFVRDQATESIASDVPAPPMRGDFFKMVDEDGDGYLTAEELTDAMPPEPPAGMRGDRPHAAPDPTELIQRLDTDKDGKLSQAEFEAGRPPEGRDPRPNPDEFFAKLDTDADGLLSSEELASLTPPADAPPMNENGPKPDPAEMVDHLDSDGDGLVSLEEFKQGHRMPPMARDRW